MAYTEDLCEGGVATASAIQNAGRSADKAFNNILGTHDDSWSCPGSSGWIKYDFGVGVQKRIRKYSITAPNSTSTQYSPKSWVLEGSNDDSEWYVVDTIEGINDWLSSQRREFLCDNTSLYRYYRYTLNSVDAYLIVDEFEMMEDLDYGYIPPVNAFASSIYHKKQTLMRGKAKEGFIRPTIAEFFTSKDFHETAKVSLGDIYEGGRYIGELNGYELILSPYDSQANLDYSTQEDDYGPANAYSLTDGYQNTVNLAAADTRYQAGTYCNNLTTGGYFDWYLPSKNELRFLWANLADLLAAGAVIDNGYSTPYWSSTTCGPSSRDAWDIEMTLGNGYQGIRAKDDLRYVRAIRRIAI